MFVQWTTRVEVRIAVNHIYMSTTHVPVSHQEWRDLINKGSIKPCIRRRLQEQLWYVINKLGSIRECRKEVTSKRGYWSCTSSTMWTSLRSSPSSQNWHVWRALYVYSFCWSSQVAITVRGIFLLQKNTWLECDVHPQTFLVIVKMGPVIQFWFFNWES